MSRGFFPNYLSSHYIYLNVFVLRGNYYLRIECAMLAETSSTLSLERKLGPSKYGRAVAMSTSSSSRRSLQNSFIGTWYVDNGVVLGVVDSTRVILH